MPHVLLVRGPHAYRDGLARLAEARPAAKELSRFCAELIADDPDDVGALWTLLGFQVRCCTNELDESVWKGSSHSAPGALDGSSSTHTAMSGVATAEPLGALLGRHGLLEQLDRPLDAGFDALPYWPSWRDTVLTSAAIC